MQPHNSNFYLCYTTTPETINEPLEMSPLPPAVWSHLSVDFFGPISDGSYLLVIICDNSRFPIVEIIHSTSARAVIPAMERVFALFGSCEELKTDNGPPFNSHELAQFVEYIGFHHRRITPAWPQANFAELFMRTVSKVLRTARVERKCWKSELSKFLSTFSEYPPQLNRHG